VERVAVVAAGAGARGAYEAGALSVLLPWLHEQGMRPTVFAGTSAGAVNASLFAAVAHEDDPRHGAEQVLDVWRSLTVDKVFRSPLVSGPLQTLPRYIGQAVGLPRAHVISLLDTTPLRATARGLFERYAAALHDNIHGPEPVVDVLAVVATDDLDRSVVFADLAAGVVLPAPEPTRAIDYQRTSVSFEHVLASSAIPALFGPVAIDGRWYIDGGVRLNVPLKPAIALGASRLAVVATHPSTYPVERKPPPATQQPDVVDGIVDVLNAVLADRMVEDLHTLEKVNQLVAPERTRSGQLSIPYVFVGPETRRQLGDLAAAAYNERARGLGGVLREPDFWVLDHLIGPREQGAGDILSYIFFDQGFLGAAIELGVEHATAVTEGPDPWTRGAPARPTGS
jgi:NTE family protein